MRTLRRGAGVCGSGISIASNIIHTKESVCLFEAGLSRRGWLERVGRRAGEIDKKLQLRTGLPIQFG